MAKFKLNIKYIFSVCVKLCSVLFTGITFFLAFISWEEIGINSSAIRLLILFVLTIFIFIVSCILVLFFIKEKQVWKRGKNKVSAMYSDLFKIAFHIYKNKRIIVIPVNDTFETIIEEPGENVVNPLVSSETIHGRWISKYLNETGISQKELNNRIQTDLKKRGAIGLKRDSQTVKGNDISFPLGTIAVIDGPKNSIFYLVAISKFDENNQSHSIKRQIRDCIDDLLEFYDREGQGKPIYIPLMGTGRSRANLSHIQSFKIIKSTVLTNEAAINGEINIVVYEKDKDKVSIF